MNKFAFDILDEKKLIRPTQYALSDIGKLSSDKKIFLRYNENFKSENKVVTCSYILQHMNELRKESEAGVLVQMAELINSIAGCVIYVKDGYIYGEYVEGEPIALLRRGICGKRFLIDSKKKVLERPVFQNWICRQGVGKYEWEPYKSLSSPGYSMMIESLSEIISKKHNNYLFEIHIEKSRIIFSDARYKDIDITIQKFIKIFEISGKLNLKGSVDYNKMIKIDGFDIDCCHQIPSNIIIHCGAILSHYIIYNFNEIENIDFMI